MPRIEQTIEVNVPVRTAYNQLTQFQEFPRFMEGVHEVKQIDNAHLHWRAEKSGKEMEWDAEITEQVPDKIIAWNNTSGPKNSGKVVFQELAPDKTRITLVMEGDEVSMPPQKGAGSTANQHSNQDLVRFKKMIESAGKETGEWRGEIHGSQQVSETSTPRSSGDTSSLQNASIAAHSSGEGATTLQTAKTEAAKTSSARDDYEMPAMRTISHPRRRSTDRKLGPGESDSGADSERYEGAIQTTWDLPQNPSSGFRADNHSTSPPLGQITQQNEPLRSKSEWLANQQNNLGQLKKSWETQNWLPQMLRLWEQPLQAMRTIAEDMNLLMGKFANPLSPLDGSVSQHYSSARLSRWLPNIDISQDEKRMVVYADLPGIQKENIKVKVQKNRLIIEGERREQNNLSFSQVERRFGYFYRSIALPPDVDSTSVKASMKDGVLEITIPIAESSIQAYQVPVTSTAES